MSPEDAPVNSNTSRDGTVGGGAKIESVCDRAALQVKKGGSPRTVAEDFTAAKGCFVSDATIHA